MNPITNLVQKYVSVSGHTLISHLDDARLIAEMADRATAVTVTHYDWSTLQFLQRKLKRFGNIHFSDNVFPDEPCDTACVVIPKGRDYARAILCTALQQLPVDGYLFAVGPNAGGAKTIQNDMKSIAPTYSMGSKASHRVFSVRRTADFAIPDEWGTPWQRQALTLTYNDADYTVYTQPGVFSWEHLDDGTAFLLDYATQLEPASTLLDAGCGYGIVGMVLGGAVTFADSNILAVQCVQAALPDADALCADLTAHPLPQRFERIVCNPPFHKDHAQSIDFIKQFAPHAKHMLTSDGQVLIVANAFLPYREVLVEHFDRVALAAEDERYRVWVATGS